MISNYTYSNTNYLGNGCDIVTLTHNSTEAKLSLSKTSTEKDVIEIFKRFLENTEINQLNTFVYNPEPKKAFVVEFGVQDRTGYSKPKFSFLCLGSKKQEPISKDPLCVDKRFIDQINLLNSKALIAPTTAFFTTYPLSRKQGIDEGSQRKNNKHGDVVSHIRILSTHPDVPHKGPAFLDFERTLPTGKINEVISRETEEKISFLLETQVNELIASIFKPTAT